mgnify:CR=1 FL=1
MIAKYYLILKDVVIKNTPTAIKIDAKIKIIISFNIRISSPKAIRVMPAFNKRLDPCLPILYRSFKVQPMT